MEGTWGRRVFGFVKKKEDSTYFEIEIETREGRKVGSRHFLFNEELESYPWLYAQTLDSMVSELEIAMREINPTQGDQQ